MGKVKLNAIARVGSTKGAARRLRMTGRIPVVCYGRAEESLSASINPLDLAKLLAGPHGPNLVFDLVIDDNGKETTREVIVKGVQRDPVTRKFLHADLYAVTNEHPITVRVPFRMTGRAAGVALGGSLRQAARDVIVKCLPQDIPVEIPVDVKALGIKESIKIGQVTPPTGCTFVFDNNFPVAEVMPPRE